MPRSATPASALSTRQIRLNEQLLRCASQRDAPGLLQALSSGADPDARDSLLRGALHLAAQGNDTESLLALLPHADPHGRDRVGRTPFLSACAHGAASCAQLLMPVSDIRAQDARGDNALMLCAHNGHPGLLADLLPRLDPHARNKEGDTALIIASRINTPVISAACVETLLGASDARALNKAGWSALMGASLMDNARSVALLLPHSDPDHTSANAWGWISKPSRGSWNAWTLAALGGAEDCSRLLLAAIDPLATMAPSQRRASELIHKITQPAFFAWLFSAEEALALRADLLRAQSAPAPNALSPRL